MTEAKWPCLSAMCSKCTRGDIAVPKWTMPRMPKAAAKFGEQETMVLAISNVFL